MLIGLIWDLINHIKKVVKYENVIVVLYYDNKIISNNVIAFDLQGDQLWKVNDIFILKDQLEMLIL